MYLATLLLLVPSSAFAVDFSDCGTSNPLQPGTSVGCTPDSNAICEVSGGVATCDLDNDCDGGMLTAVQGWGSYDFTAFGICNNNGTAENFCCYYNESATSVTEFELFGSDSFDNQLKFKHKEGSTLYNMGPAGAANLDGLIQGGDEYDYVRGADNADSDYDEVLKGGAGDDLIYPGEGYDAASNVAYGEAGNDTLFGDDDEERLIGGAGADTYWAGGGDDQLCETCPNGDAMHGEGGDDEIWAGAGVSCANPHEVDGGQGDDSCGNTSTWSGFFECENDLTNPNNCP